ncbi:alpha/beta hydrolase [Bacillus sp. JCM 19041]|uniref:alpha/beta fold hydrolase n=1 Tax=Bacillus sp. JCM 19041 TaxID=1460637 RepID=UPI0006D11FC0
MSKRIESKEKRNRSGTTVVKEYVEINAVKQGLIIEKTDDALPVLLVLHGGPGYPLYPIMNANKVGLHQLFTVCYWDQRGTGMSYLADENRSSLTVEQLISDTVEVSGYVADKFSKEKIYLMGHSWGTFLGSLTASAHPDLYHAYLGVGHVGSAKETEKETYQFILNQAKETGNQKWISEIEKVEFDDQYYKKQEYNVIREKYTNKFGGGFLRKGYSHYQGLKDVFTTRFYTLKERANVFRGSFASYQALGEVLATTDLVNEVKEFAIPVYIFQGKHDRLTSHRQALRFYNEIKAPKKNFFTFEHSRTHHLLKRRKFSSLC